MNIWRNNKFFTQQFLLIVVAILFSGCAVLPSQQPPTNQDKITIDPAKQENKQSAMGWWQIGFHRPYLSDDDVQWQYDSLIALKVLKPVIDDSKDLGLWRFHRRAADDSSGHKFSFIFYATREMGEIIYQQVSEHPMVQKLLSESHLERLSFYDINSELRSDIENTSDKKWPIELQKSWPYFIMGVSQTWLSLVELLYEKLQINKEADFEDQLEGFKQVSADIDLIWKHNGNHAFLHHLNALFAYQELYVIESQLRRF